MHKPTTMAYRCGLVLLSGDLNWGLFSGSFHTKIKNAYQSSTASRLNQKSNGFFLPITAVTNSTKFHENCWKLHANEQTNRGIHTLTITLPRWWRQFSETEWKKFTVQQVQN